MFVTKEKNDDKSFQIASIYYVNIFTYFNSIRCIFDDDILFVIKMKKLRKSNCKVFFCSYNVEKYSETVLHNWRYDYDL